MSKISSVHVSIYHVFVCSGLLILFMPQIEKIDIITAAMGNALATDGGFCTGSVRVVDHQVGEHPPTYIVQLCRLNLTN